MRLHANRFSFREILAAVAILILALAVRFYRLDYQSLWSDEGNSVILARASFSEIAQRTAIDIHPPLYYWILKLWASVFGESEFAVRALSAVLGLLLVINIYGLGRRLFGQSAGIAAAFVAALHPFQIYYAQETRMYLLLTLWSAVSVWLAVEIWCRQHKFLFTWGASYALITALGLYTHYAFPIILVVINGTALLALRFPQRRFWLWSGLQTIPILLYLPWLPIATRQITTWPALVETVSPTEIGLTLAQYLSLGPVADHISATWLWVFGGVILYGLGSVMLDRDKQGQDGLAILLVVLWLLLPASLTAFLFRPAYLKIFLIASPAFCLLISLGIIGLGRPMWRIAEWQRTVLAGTAVVLLALPSVWVLNGYYHLPQYQRDDYRGIAAFIEAVATSEDAVIIHAPGQQEVYSYYAQDNDHQPKVYPLPQPRPLVLETTLAELQTIVAQADRIYGIFWATQEADPDGVVERWLTENTFKARDIWFGNVRLVSYAAASYSTTEQHLALKAHSDQFGEAIHLTAASLSHTKIAPGEILQLRLVWETMTVLETEYTVFVQMLDAANHLVGQRDAPPLRATTAWIPEELVEDNHGLFIEPGTPPGLHRVIVGLYDAATGQRLVNAIGNDFILLAEIEVMKNKRPLPHAAFHPQYPFNERPLLGYDLSKLGQNFEEKTVLRSGEPLHLTLYWQNIAGLLSQDTVTLKLRNSQGRVLTHWQRPLAGVEYPLQQWAEEEIVRAQFNLFLSDVPLGAYQLEVAIEEAVLGITKPFMVVE